jgi:hypothetical protein
MKYALLIATVLVFNFGCEKAKPTAEAQPAVQALPAQQDSSAKQVTRPYYADEDGPATYEGELSPYVSLTGHFALGMPN